jgi:DUF917 family protein
MHQMNREDLARLALGSAVLGSGGGGDPAYDRLMAEYALETYGPVEIIQLQDLEATDLIAPFEFIGAPLVAIEQLPQGEEFLKIAELIQKTCGRSIRALVPGEIGGGNAFTPLIIASRLGLPVIDGDLIGRAFPQIQMCATHLAGVSPSPAFLADGLGNSVIVHAQNSAELEKIARQIAVVMGSHCAMSSFLMNGREAQQAVIPGSISRACAIGVAILDARKQGISPVEAVIDCCYGVLLTQGVICDINQSIREGFLEGTVQIQTKKGIVELVYQNEYLLARSGAQILATTPDILTILESESGTPITSESLKYGLRVDLIALPAPEIWKTPAGLELVGPQFFGFNVPYSPVQFQMSRSI